MTIQKKNLTVFMELGNPKYLSGIQLYRKDLQVMHHNFHIL
jgi:hypothetical protein